MQKEALDVHILNKCKKFPIPCSFCGDYIERGDILEHERKICD